MAFYTSRVDSEGKEIERRHSARSLSTTTSGSTTSTNTQHIHLSSSRSCDSKSSSVRYVNAAAFVEKNTTECSEDTSSMTDDHKYNESESDIVPPLDIQSEENYPTTRDYTFSYRKHCEAAKIVLKPDLAYETWLSAKRKVLSDEAARRKKVEDQKRREQEERRHLAEEKFQQWLQNKSRTKLNNRSRPASKTSDHSMQIVASRASQYSEQEAQAKIEEWHITKQLEEERRRMLKRQEEEQRRELEEQRRRMAAEAWDKWLADAGNKPKPVPLNRGFFTLKGTVSNIFVNPNEWKTVAPLANDE